MSATVTDNRNLEEVCAWQEERIAALYARVKQLEALLEAKGDVSTRRNPASEN